MGDGSEYETVGDKTHDVGYLKGRLSALEERVDQESARTQAKFQAMEETWGNRLDGIEKKVDALLEAVAMNKGGKAAVAKVVSLGVAVAGAGFGAFKYADQWMPIVRDLFA
jgi:tetrahydromethanopterin S-methyltransferase subunit G